MILDFLIRYIGQPPEGFEFLQYVVASQLLIFVVWSVLNFFAAILNLFRVGGR